MFVRIVSAAKGRRRRQHERIGAARAVGSAGIVAARVVYAGQAEQQLGAIRVGQVGAGETFLEGRGIRVAESAAQQGR